MTQSTTSPGGRSAAVLTTVVTPRLHLDADRLGRLAAAGSTAGYAADPGISTWSAQIPGASKVAGAGSVSSGPFAVPVVWNAGSPSQEMSSSVRNGPNARRVSRRLRPSASPRP